MIEHLEAVETAAEDVLTDRRHIIELSRKQNGLREARRALAKTTANNSKQNTWIVAGNTFIKLPVSGVKTLLEEDMHSIDTEINTVRDGLRDKVNKLNALEQRPEVKGFNLKSLSKDERSVIHKML